jgi:hypothetical protein
MSCLNKKFNKTNNRFNFKKFFFSSIKFRFSGIFFSFDSKKRLRSFLSSSSCSSATAALRASSAAANLNVMASKLCFLMATLTSALAFFPRRVARRAVKSFFSKETSF